MKKIIYTDDAPQAIGPYSQAIQAGKFLYLSGSFFTWRRESSSRASNLFPIRLR